MNRYSPPTSLFPYLLLLALCLGCGESATDPEGGNGNGGGGGGGGGTLGQDGAWMWANPNPQGDPVWRIEYASESIAFAVTAGGSVMKSSDGGENWEVIYRAFDALPYAQAFLYGLHFLDEKEGWVVGSAGQVIHTQDGGESWTDRSIDLGRQLHDVHFVDPMNGITVGQRGALYRSTDAGMSWTPIAHLAGEKDFNAVAFDKNGDGWIGGDEEVALHSGDGGLTWTQIIGTWRGNISSAHAMTSGGVAFANEQGGLALVSTPVSWSYVFGADHILDGHFQDRMNGAVGYVDDDKTYVGTLRAGTWTHEEVGIDLSANTFAISGDNASIGGWWGLMTHSADGGATWNDSFELTHTFRSQLWGVDFDGQLGVAAGSGGAILRSDDAGVNWEVRSSPTDEDFWSAYVGHDLAFVTGDNSVLLRSTDLGMSWTPVAVDGDPARLHELRMFDSQHGVLAGGGLQMTEDGGLTWTIRGAPMPDALNATFCVTSVGATHAWLGARSGHIIRTINGGQSWSLHDTGASRAIQSIFFIDELHGWAGTHSQEFVYTTDGGDNWTQIWLPGSVQDVEFGSRSIGIAVGPSGGVFGSSDGGVTWEQQRSAVSGWSHVRSISMISESDAVVVGTESKILYTRSAGNLPD